MMSFKQFIDEDVRKMPDGTFGVFADKFKTVKTNSLPSILVSHSAWLSAVSRVAT
jgi:hypothetical protein